MPRPITLKGILALARSLKAIGMMRNSRPLIQRIRRINWIKVEGYTDVKLYNKAVAKIWCIFGAIFILLGLPLLAGQNSFLIICSILGIFLECIFLMISLRKVEIKYRKR